MVAYYISISIVRATDGALATYPPCLAVGTLRQSPIEQQNGDLGRARADHESNLSKPSYESDANKCRRSDVPYVSVHLEILNPDDDECRVHRAGQKGWYEHQLLIYVSARFIIDVALRKAYIVKTQSPSFFP